MTIAFNMTGNRCRSQALSSGQALVLHYMVGSPPPPVVMPPDVCPETRRDGRALPSARDTPDQLTTHCDLNITLVTEVGMFIVLFSVPPRYCHSSSHQLAHQLRVPI